MTRGGTTSTQILAVLTALAGLGALAADLWFGLFLAVAGGGVAVTERLGRTHSIQVFATAILVFQAMGRLPDNVSFVFWVALVGLWLGLWMLVALVVQMRAHNPWLEHVRRLIPPLLFGATLLWLWETVVTALDVPRVILPAPSSIGARIVTSTDILWLDFTQTFVKGALSGYAIGVGAAFIFALAVDRSDFLRRGLLPVGNFLAALPIIGTAPIFVMWFGFDWPSKAAVVVAMVFFPVLVNTVQGLAAADRMQRDLMHTYSAGWVQSLVKLRLPAAMPFIFNGLKVASTLALIGAIVAEFFGSPTRGMGFRISTEVGRLQLDMVWAEIAIAALAGSLFYGILALVERVVTFWHPSQRGR